MTLASLARYLSGRLDAPVQDLTGLKGTYDIDVSWVPDRAFEPSGPYAEATKQPSPADGEAGLPTPTADIFAAFRDSLGLKLERSKQQVEVIVIDHIDRGPTED